MLGLVVGDGGILLGSSVGNLVTITHVLVLPVLGLVDGIGSDGHRQGINERIRRHTHTGGILHQSAMPVLAGREDVVSGLTGKPPLAEQREILHTPVPSLHRIGYTLYKVFSIRFRQVSREGQELLQCREYPQGDLRCGDTLGYLHDGLVHLRHTLRRV